VHRRTGGNPFFVEQSARLWHSGGSATAVSPGVRDALQRRLSMLPAAVADLLTAAAVLGREFHRHVLAATVSAPDAHVDRLLDQAVTARLVVVLGAGEFAFAHDLVRETLYDGLDPADARRRHAEVVRALDRTPGVTGRILPADLARHGYLAGTELDPDRAVDLLLAAAQDATNRLAVEEGIGHLRRALERSEGNPRRVVNVALDLGAALHMAGETDEAWQAYESAVRVARGVDDDVVRARVALTLVRTDPDPDRARQDAQALVASVVSDAYARLVGPVPAGAAPVPSTLMLLAEELAGRFLTLVRAGTDDDMLRFALWARHNTIWGPGTAPERLALTDDLIVLGRRLADPMTEHMATSFQWVALLELGDPRYLERYHAFVAMAERLGMPNAAFSSLIDRSIILALRGRFAEAEACLDEAAARYSHRHPHFVHMGHHLRWAMLLAQGRFAELDGVHRTLAESGHPYPGLLEAITALHRDVAPPPVDTAQFADALDFRSMVLRLEAQLAARSGDPGRCEQVRAALLPHAGEWLLSMYGCDISGPVDLWLALLDVAQRRFEPAFERFGSARASADRLGARPWSVEIRVRQVAALRARGGPGDETAAAALWEGIVADAAELGMRHVAGAAPAPSAPARSAPAPSAPARSAPARSAPARSARVPSSSAWSGPAASGAAPSGPARSGPAPNAFRRDGAVWTLAYAGRTIHFPDAKGLHDLHILLARPGEAVAAVDLLNPAGGDLVRAAGRFGGDPVLDDEAKIRYKRRLTELDDEIDRAALRDDRNRVTDLAGERDALLAELRAAAGLAGRTRRLGDEAERARKTVTARIRDTLRRLDEMHPELAAHLRDAVSTGATCVYTPPQPTPWHL
jgi:tetratricopeptide (TPR) repeat protein